MPLSSTVLMARYLGISEGFGEPYAMVSYAFLNLPRKVTCYPSHIYNGDGTPRLQLQQDVKWWEGTKSPESPRHGRSRCNLQDQIAGLNSLVPPSSVLNAVGAYDWQLEFIWNNKEICGLYPMVHLQIIAVWSVQMTCFRWRQKGAHSMDSWRKAKMGEQESRQGYSIRKRTDDEGAPVTWNLRPPQ